MSEEENTFWTLVKGEEVVARLQAVEVDMPWIFAEFEPLPGFAPYAPLFAEELAILDASAEEGAEDGDWEAVYDKIVADLDLLMPDGTPVEYLLHIDGPEAWFRFMEAPDDDAVEGELGDDDAES